jgi:hypothetical protein
MGCDSACERPARCIVGKKTGFAVHWLLPFTTRLQVCSDLFFIFFLFSLLTVSPWLVSSSIVPSTKVQMIRFSDYAVVSDTQTGHDIALWCDIRCPGPW